MKTHLLLCLLALFGCCAAAAESSSKIVYDNQVRALFKARCFKCHDNDQQEKDLNLETFQAAMKGSSSGAVLKAGRPNSSLLYQAITHAEGVEKMPPKSDKLADADIEIIRQWIVAGMPENSGSKTRAAATFDFKPASAGRPAAPAMPVGLNNTTSESGPVTALASSPWAPLVAVAGYEQIKLLHAETQQPLGTLPFPEGTPFVLRFSRDGSVLLAAGGQPAQSGKVVLYDVKSGKRLAAFGDESDVVLAADFTADGSLVALGGPSKTVKVFRTKDGQMLYQIKKHTDWITALAFSPDSRQLATADRAGGIHLWDAASGGIALSLSEHKESVTALSWRSDGRLLASASEDGSVILWDMKDGFPSCTLSDIHVPKFAGKSYGKPRSGVLSLAWTPEGNLLTTGRDRMACSWSNNGTLISRSMAFSALPTRVDFVSSAGVVCVGDDKGIAHMIRLKENAWDPVQSGK